MKTQSCVAANGTMVEEPERWSLTDWTDTNGGDLTKELYDNASLGQHLLVEMYDCDRDRLCDIETIEKMMLSAARISKATVVTHNFHKFQPFGVSGAVIIQESHYTIHTWPEFSYAAIDLFYCSNEVDIEKAVELINETLMPKKTSMLLVRRGRI